MTTQFLYSCAVQGASLCRQSKTPRGGAVLLLSVLFSYFGDSTVHQIGTQSTVGSLPEAHCGSFGLSKWIKLRPPTGALGACQQGPAQNNHVVVVDRSFDNYV